MKKFLAAVSAFAMLAGTAHAAGESQPHVFKPSGPWAAEYGDDYCRLARTFSDGTDTLSIALERIQASNAARLIIVGNGIKLFRSSTQLEYTLAPSGGEHKGLFWRSETAEGQQYLNLGDLFLIAPGPPLPPPELGKRPPWPTYDRAAEQEFAKGINTLALTGGVTEPVRIETGGLKAPIASLQACADDLLKIWGLDPVKHQTMSAFVWPSNDMTKWLPAGTLAFADFPKLAGGANQVRVMVSAEGKPTACAIHWPSLEKKANDAICKAVMEKAAFFPALDKDGQPMASYFTTAPAFMMSFGGT